MARARRPALRQSVVLWGCVGFWARPRALTPVRPRVHWQEVPLRRALSRYVAMARRVAKEQQRSVATVTDRRKS
ncbi:hypothetical protein AAFF_G00170700 [Aldrovandia affinis]|uniref:Uncharacterized protein n=1 Tax=Aldrovandia affinis TaxID=143900 RepID=A0AAD7RLP0_9TELE|nr:hypothetical protein AAFF_G00170700 [Aldrovandia affinis]